jgi:hypothetical protein
MNKSPWHVLDAARPRLLKCLPTAQLKSEQGTTSTRNRNPQWHFRGQLQPVSSLSEEELRGHWLALAEYGVKGDSEKSDWATLFGYSEENAAKLEEDIEQFRSQHKPITDALIDPTLQDNPVDIPSYYTKFTHPVLPLPADPAGLRKESHPFIKIGMDTLTNENFDQLWAKGEPILVEGIAKKFQKMWTPKEMVSNFGSDFCGESSYVSGYEMFAE